MQICALGTGGHLPKPDRFLASMIIKTSAATTVLIDCGEGTQISMLKYGWNARDINVILLTHLHFDHIGGLSGLLATLRDNRRKQELTIVGPMGTERLVSSILAIIGPLHFTLKVIELTKPVRHLRFADLQVEAQLVNHTVTCYAYNIICQHPRECLPDKARKNQVPEEYWGEIQKNGFAIDRCNKRKYTISMISCPCDKRIKISYCTDTLPTSEMSEFFNGADILVCEAMYNKAIAQKSQSNKFRGSDYSFVKKHMTYEEAAAVASQSDVQELWLTHFSPTINNPRLYATEAYNIFKNTVVLQDGYYVEKFF